MAAVLAAGRPDSSEAPQPVLDRWGAALSHRSAAELWRLLEPYGGLVHVSIPGRAGRRRDSIRVHRPRSLQASDVTSRDGIPVTTPARTIADLRRASATKGSSGGVSPRELRRAIRQADVLGLPLEEKAAHDRTRSDLERLFLRLCRAHALPPPKVNVRIGAMLVDFVWPDRWLVVETDGYRYHRGRAAFEDDRARDLRLRALGFDVIRLSGRQLEDQPEHVVGVLRRRLGAAP